MSVLTMVTIIVVVGVTADLIGKVIKGRQQVSANREGLNAVSQRLDRLETELRSRIETLEAIVTDRRSNLKREFDYLDRAS